MDLNTSMTALDHCYRPFLSHLHGIELIEKEQLLNTSDLNLLSKNVKVNVNVTII